MVSSYLLLAQLDVPQQLVSSELTKLESYLSNNDRPAINWEYQIPELGEGGACSLFGYLQETPFKLTDYLKQDSHTTEKLTQLQRIVNYVVEQTGVDWYGIYQNTATDEGAQLLKLAYFGAPSRPLFPLTKEFAAGSNNVQVALSTKGRVINNVEQYLAAGGEYYTCDPKVKAEACLPLFDEQNNCVGIVDGEAFNNDFFDQQTLALLIACCIKIPHFLV
ncbi:MULTISPECIES: GAF domain-containing protein [unclassified Pseudoalteromonas]|uniref:GAF domain-containing protein n=1 Tax=unclassified Pseudoalteromonas TaxID=194690 RepID=UPI0025B2E356|nr:MULTISPECIES: GAF domain-containing protein [unclassified Pseudoalteromonas]MDN3378100.1 histidine kinase [Pseudoalteromonas sp. APC 3893]MDN3386865.1 histidine kinase [Pseudoalteromonas sp. APC 4017]